MLDRILPSRTTAALVSSQEVSMAKIVIRRITELSNRQTDSTI
jgi:hypothetical protein